MIVFYFIHSLLAFILTIIMSFIFIILGWWFLLLPKYKRFRLFEYLIAYPWIFLFQRVFLFMRIKIIGKKNVDRKRTTFYICNHQSWLDVPVFLRYSHAIGVSKKEVRRIFLVGVLILMSGGVILLDRKEQASRLATIKKIINVFKKGFSIYLFPEGTRSRDGKLLKPNTSIIRLCYKLNIPVVPSALEGTRDVLPRKRIYFKCFKKVIVKFTPPLYPKDYNSEQEFADACWGKVKETHESILKEYFPYKLTV